MRGSEITYALVYVDDIILTGTSASLISELITALDAKFALKDLGSLHYFLGIEVKRLRDGYLFLSEGKYIRGLLRKVGFKKARGEKTPMASGLSLTREGTAVFPDVALYRKVVGSLQYATITRPDICFAVNKVCQFLQTPYIEHWKVVKRILRYLAGSINHGLILRPSPTWSLVAFCDADWAADKDDRKSVTGYCIYFGSNLVLWSSKKQCTVSRSSTEAEYRSMASTVAELLWLQSLLSELRIKLVRVLYVLCENLSAVMITTNPVLHSRTKHLELDLHFVQELAIWKEIRVQHIPSTSQVADGLTKAISCRGFPLFKEQLCVRDVP